MSATDIRLIAVDLIDPHPHNPRRDLGDLTELAASIKAHGIRQNLLVVPMHPDWPCEEPDYLSDGDDGREYCAVCDTNDRPSNIRYRAVIGHRRLPAALLAGLTEVPAAVDYMLTEAQQLELMLLENIQRADLSPVEEAEGYQQLLDLGVKVRAIAKATGRAEKTVTGRLRLLALPERVREQVHTGQATLEDAAQLQRFVDGTDPTDKKMLDKLAGAMGTTNFKWEIQNAERTLEQRKRRAELAAACEARGIEVVKEGDRIGYAWHRYVPDVQSLDNGADDPEGCILSGETLWRPVTQEERTKSDDNGDARARREEFDRKLLEESQAARQLRDDFVRKVLQRKRLAHAERDAIILHVAPLAIAYGLAEGWRIAEWLGLDTHYRSAADRLDLLAEHYPEAQPAAVLLLALHLCAEGPWFNAHSDPKTVGLYRALIALGYQLSDAERARVFPEGEAVCTECQHPADDHDIDDGTCCFSSVCDCPGLVLAEAGA